MKEKDAAFKKQFNSFPDFADEYKQMCEIKTNRYEMQKLHEEMNEDRRKNEEAKQSS